MITLSEGTIRAPRAVRDLPDLPDTPSAGAVHRPGPGAGGGGAGWGTVLGVQVELTARAGRPGAPGVDVVVRCPQGTRLDAVAPALAAVTGARGPAVRVRAAGHLLDAAWPVGRPPLVRGAELVLEDAAATSSPGGALSAPLEAPGPLGGAQLCLVGGAGAGGRTALPLGRCWLGTGDGSLLPVAGDPAGVPDARLLELETGPTGTRVRCTAPSGRALLDGRPLTGAWRALPVAGVLQVGRSRLELRPGTSTAGAARPGQHRPVPDDRGGLLLPAASAAPVGEGTAADTAGEDVSVALPPAPQRRAPAPVSWPAVLVPLLVAVPLAVLWSPLVLLLGLSGPLVVLLTRAAEHRSTHRQLHRDRTAHEADVALARARAHRLAREQLGRLEHLHPGPAELREVVDAHDPRLWSRRGGPVVVRLGSAPAPSRTVLVTDGTGTGNSTGNSTGTGTGTGDERVVHAHAPVTLDLAASPVLEVRGPAPARWGAVRCVLLQLAVLHPPEHLHLDLGAAADAHDWARWLPHTAAAPADSSPAHGVVVHEGSGEVTRLHLAAAPELGGTGPAVLTVGLDGAAVLEVPGDAPRALVADLVDVPVAAVVARALAPLRCSADADAAPPVPSLRQLLAATGPDPADAVALAAAWRSGSRPRAVPLGTCDDGRPWAVDLERDGPHALVAGTTGSGKSSLLLALVLALAVAAPPDELAVVVVDYKGGATAGRLRGLPHLAGAVTDLDEHLARRALDSLAAEVRRRERVLAEHGVPDRTALRELRPDGARVLPRLLVVVDEVRVLGEEVPELVPGLVRLAAVGRSLGVHLVLSTQRPAGAVSADAMANTNLRIALRVRDAADSLDVVDDDGAARLSSERPGAALVRRGGAGLQRVRVAAPRAAPPEPVTVVLRDGPAGPAAGRGGAPADGLDEVPQLVDALARAARGWARVAPPWLPALPDLLEWQDPGDASTGGCGDALAEAGSGLPLGLVDEPAVPARTPLVWGAREPLAVLGGPRSGRTSLLRWLAVAADRAGRDVLVVGDPAELGDLERLPRVRGVADPEDAEHLLRTLAACAAARDPAGPDAPVLLVDRADRVLSPGAGAAGAGRTEADAAADLLRQLLDSGAPVVVTADAALLTSRTLAGVRQVLLLRPADRSAALLAGVSRGDLPVHWPPGRALLVRSATRSGRPPECQLAVLGAAAVVRRGAPADPGDVPGPDEQNAVVTMTARDPERRGPAAGPRCAALPRRLVAADLPAPGPEAAASGAVVVGAGGDGWAELPLPAGATALVSGPPGSGRSSALRLLAARAAAPGRRVVLVRPRAALGEPVVPGVEVLDDGGTGAPAAARLLALLGVAGAAAGGAAAGPPPPFEPLSPRAPGGAPLVLVDDAELLTGTALEAALLGLAGPQEGGPATCAVVVAATAGLLPAHRGLGAVLRRQRTGLLLHPLAPGDAEALGVRPSPVRGGPPGRAGLVVAGRLEVVQLALPARP